MKQKLISLSIFLCISINMQATVWHVAVNGHGFTYNTSHTICNISSTWNPTIPITSPSNIATAIVGITPDIYNKEPSCDPSICTPTIKTTIYPCGDWDNSNNCWTVGDGTEAHPWSLEFALSNPPDPTQVDGTNYWLLDEKTKNLTTNVWTYTIPRWIQPGDIIYVHDGNFSGLPGAVYNGRTIYVTEQTLYDYKNSSSSYPELIASGSLTNIVNSRSGVICGNTSNIGNYYEVHLQCANITDVSNILSNSEALFLHTYDISGHEFVYLFQCQSPDPICSTCINAIVIGTNYKPRNINTLNGPPPATFQNFDVFNYTYNNPVNYSPPNLQYPRTVKNMN